ncbi:DUF859 family phage minor structural protein [Streptococcus sp. VTCC 12886]|uniref:DUF859 family phage minor structural protein n=1 Tax=Streptococcus sp. VTCC 12886 TaxID=3413767 RepID=UPI003D9C6B86
MAIFRYSGNWRSYLEGSSSTVSQNIAGNSSVIKVDVWIGMDAGWSIEFGNTYGNSVTVNCDGQSQTISVGPLYLNGSKKYLGSVQFTVGHNADGTKSAGISLSSNMSNISYGSLSFGNASGSWTHGLPTIPRASSVSFSNGTIGSPLAITINRASTSFTHTLRWEWGGRSGTIASGLTTSASWTIPMDFCNELPNNVSGTGTIFVDTYSGSTKIGTQSRTFTANVPSSVIPTFTGITLDDQNATAKALITGNTFVQIMSDIKVTFNGAAGAYGSTIKGFRAEVLNKNIILTSNGGTLGPMDFNGTATIRASVTDSRGKVSATKDVTITLLEYYAPVISIQVLRTRENPNKLQVLRTIKVAPLTFNNANKNSTKLVFEAAPLGSTSFVVDTGSAGGEWTTIFTLTNSEANLGGTYDSTTSWTVQAKLSDKFTSSNPTIASATVGTEKVINAYDKDGRFGVGKIPELGPAGSVDAAGNIYASDMFIAGKALRDIFYPVGSIYQSIINTNPSTFIGGTWERFGNGRVLVGVDENDSDFNVPNRTGGEKAHQITVEEMPSHSHQFNTEAGGSPIAQGWENGNNSAMRAKLGNYTMGLPTTSVGGNNPHNNLQPYITVYRWRRIA